MSTGTPPAYPRATIRLQFNAEFTFTEARELVPYLASLGFSHLYGSPILLARPGSTHGYDIIDHSRLNPEIGTPEDFDELVRTLHTYEMGFIMDFVPNHMGVGGADNGWWLDVLEWGPASPFARFFDIDWHPFEKSLDGKVLLPVLGDQYGRVLENGELNLAFSEDDGSMSVWYFTHRFPVAIRHYAQIIREVVRELNEPQGDAAGILNELARRAVKIGKGSSRPRTQAMEHAEARDIKGSLAALARSEGSVAGAIDRTLRRYNGTAGEPRSFDSLHRLLEQQAYRPSYWRVASNEINYRRFFDINNLAAIRMEDPELFELTHGLLFHLFEEGKIQGLRLDHVDGLYDPADYFERLQHRAAYTQFRQPAPSDAGPVSAGETPAAPAPSRVRIDQPLYVIVEKILAHHEQLRGNWQVSGTTGYEYMNLSGELFNDPDGEEPFETIYREVCDEEESYEEAALRARYGIMTNSLASELNVLANRFNRLAKQSRRTRDFSRIGFRNAIADVAAHFPVYRSYVDACGASDEDRRDIDWAVAQARKQAAIPDTSIYDFIHDVLTTDLVQARAGSGSGAAGGRRREFRRADVVDLAMKFQQFTGPVAAKSLEDTAFYRYVRFVARNEVGADPSRFYASPQAFHLENRYRAGSWPFCMLTTATHDHKRGEDVRMRLAALSERSGEWRAFIARMAELGSFFKTEVDGEAAPSAPDEYFFYQTVLGTWPFELSGSEYPGIEDYAARISAYMRKAAREAKVRTGWTAVNEPYETALAHFVESVLSLRRGRILLREIESFIAQIAPAGAVYSLSQLLLRLTVPGVPDTYQGCELWDLTLVDPDNRRPVDFELRRRLFSSCSEAIGGKGDLGDTCARLLKSWRDGGIKQYLLAAALKLRASEPDLFAAGSYEPIETAGVHGKSVVAFSRELGGSAVIVVVPRLVAGLSWREDVPLPSGWDDTELRLPAPPDAETRTGESREYRDQLTGRLHRIEPGGTVPVGELLARFPVSLLYSSAEKYQEPCG